MRRLKLGVAMLALAAANAQTTASDILDAAGMRGGLVAHVGCGDGRLTAALRANEGILVHGLDTDPQNVAKARGHIRSAGLYGPVSVDQWDGERLPYADNLVNLLISDAGRVSQEEIMRALAPGGVAVVGGVKTVKGRPSDIDEWTHFLHDAGNNAVARDARVGAPRSLRWSAPPRWLRSHETPSGFQAMVCGGGRLFYILDEGLIGITDQRLPERWALLCRDAFNGKLLWRRPIGKWGWPEWARERFENKDWTTITGARTIVPDENQRRLVADGDRLYVTLSYRAPLTILDAATGKELATVAGTDPVRQIIAADGVAVVYSQIGDPKPEKGGRGRGKRGAAEEAAPAGALMAVRGKTGDILWRRDIGSLGNLSLAIDRGRVVYETAGKIACLGIERGEPLWETERLPAKPQTLVAHEGVVMILAGKGLSAFDGATGRLLWAKVVPLTRGLGGEGLYIINGVAWPDMLSVNDAQAPADKSPHVLAVGYDVRTGEERKRLFVKDLRSPEHHHRCYRNKATERFIISSMEGLELLDLRGADHSQNNFVRGACRLGIMPANGMLYVPPDQCFCEPGAKLLGFAAIGAEIPVRTVPDERRFEKGPAYGQTTDVMPGSPGDADWPTFRHDAARHGSTRADVVMPVTMLWRARLGGDLTQPVSVGDRLFVASGETHALHALNRETGETMWTFVAGGRIDSPPTIEKGLVLFGCADGHVYCLRRNDGALVWRYLVAPCDRRIVVDEQIECVWPVHGSVLVSDGVAYVAAGRSTYLDGGIRLSAIDPTTGRLLRQTTLAGPFPDGKTMREVSFHISGANSDVLVSEGGAIYMRQKRLTPELNEVPIDDLSNKGERDVGLHIFSTAGLLDASWYNRTFWMYSKRWPGFQLANQAPKSGQLLVVDDAHTYAVSVFYRRNVHSTMFFPEREGYLLFADSNTTEPQIVGEAGARKPVEWLPQSEYQRREGMRALDSEAFGLDKMIGYTRAEPPRWRLWLPVRIRAMVKAGDTLFVAGPPDVLDEKDPYAAFEGRKGAQLVAVSAADGKRLGEQSLEVPPVFDGLIAIPDRLIMSCEDGSVMCMGKR